MTTDVPTSTEEPAMMTDARHRSGRVLWVLGMLLLIGSVMGAVFAYNNGQLPNLQNASTKSPGSAKDEAPLPPPGIVCIGLADLEKGVLHLHPVQQGRVVSIVEEGAVVKKGDLLLQIDDRYYQSRLKEAEADLDNAKLQKNSAENLILRQDILIQQQKAAKQIAEAKKKIAEDDLTLKGKTIKETGGAKEMIEMLQQQVNITKANIEAEKGKLDELELLKKTSTMDISRADADIAAKEARVQQAKLGVQECKLLAPDDGQILRLFARVGEILGANPKAPAVQFSPKSPKIVRAEVLQEWANNVKLGQTVVVEDDTYAGPKWEGKVKRISEWFAPKRSIIFEPFMVNDVRTLECIIEITGEEKHPLRIGQRVRVTIRHGG